MTLVTALILAASPATAVEIFEVGGDETDVFGDEAYKLNRFETDIDIHLVQFSMYLANEPGALINFVVYERGGANLWDLLWQSGNVAIDGGEAFKLSPEFDLSIPAGTQIAVGFYLTNDNLTYFYDTGGNGAEVPIGVALGSIFADIDTIQDGIVLDPLDPQDLGDALYFQQIAWEAGEPPVDDDGDGFPAGPDCNDADAAVHPGVGDACDDGVDNDCDGLVDLDDPDAQVASYWPDDDGDGAGAEGAEATVTCGEPPDGFVANDGDCDDDAADVNPGGIETCDGRDEDCDGKIDDGFDLSPSWPDTDGDGFGDEDAAPVSTCAEGAPGFAFDNTDCDDAKPETFPGAPEICDGFDNDCDFIIPIEEGSDADGDGAVTCNDCDDADADSYPGAPEELCDGVDHDCDGLAKAVAECLAENDETLIVGACEGCATGGAPSGVMAWALLGLVLRRRL